MDAFVRSLTTGQEEMITDADITRKNTVNGEKTLDVTARQTERNQDAYALLMNENYVIYGDDEYVIKNLTQSTKGRRTVKTFTAEHRFYEDLIANYIYDTLTGTYSLKQLCDFALKGTGYSVEIDSTGLDKSVEVENFGDNNSSALFQDAIEKFGCEYEINGKVFKIAKELSRHTDNQFRYRMNAQDPQMQIDTTNLCTYIRGFGKPEETDIFDGWVALGIDGYLKDQPTLDDDTQLYELRGLGQGFKFSFYGTGFKIKLMVHVLGGKWQFKIDNDTTKTISTYNESYTDVNPVYKEFDIIRGLDNKEHSVVVTNYSRDGKNPHTTGDNEPVMIMPEGACLGLYRPRHGYDELYTCWAEYTSPLAKTYGIRHATPVRDDRFTQYDSLLAYIKSQLTDSIPITITLTALQLKNLGVQDVRKGDYCFVTVEPFGIDLELRITEVDDYNNPNKPPAYTFGTLQKKAEDVLSKLTKTASSFAGVEKKASEALTMAGAVNATAVRIGAVEGEVND